MFYATCYVAVLLFFIDLTWSITLKKECPPGEVHRSCAFTDEYTCWVHADRMERVKSPPKRLPHCKAGCYCKRGLVREYPGGPCIVAAGCRNRKLQAVLKSLPTGQPLYGN
ncbi:cysteine-rich venom protein 1-like [Trichoplusia ni]|uniref:Cysteine-rich venom protein 1-like n=1 Tax=Trichoplusia ni TaxID=7111 RepID=A0A7E5VXR8_TRINI|nr:cysteine-rich venom protein 1-like [Trichoplusia ni]XP_026732912.1 cysteine-rich venom protein 1-like [Trichoplusia ni]